MKKIVIGSILIILVLGSIGITAYIYDNSIKSLKDENKSLKEKNEILKLQINTVDNSKNNIMGYYKDGTIIPGASPCDDESMYGSTDEIALYNDNTFKKQHLTICGGGGLTTGKYVLEGKKLTLTCDVKEGSQCAEDDNKEIYILNDDGTLSPENSDAIFYKVDESLMQLIRQD